MHELVACLQPARVALGGGVYVVPPPPVRVALTVYAALAAFEAEAMGDDGAWAVCGKACRSWLPRRLYGQYFGPSALPEATARDLGALLAVGILDAARHQADRAVIENEAKKRSWFAVLADFCNTLSVSPQDALTLPWPLFVGLAAEVVRLQARRATDVLMGYAAARTGGELLDGLMTSAGMKQDGSTGFEEPAWMDAAWEARQIARAEALFATRRAKTGEA